jgi:16S rRNA (adenine1518-N6/adenine1519-N6)-dimethyltransferase
MMVQSSLPPLRDVLEAHGITAKKSLGQNFLLDLNLTGKIARAAGYLEGRTVLEIGAGPGGLTRALLDEGAKHVIAIERDERCLSALEEVAKAYPGRLTVVAGDALEIHEEDLLRQHGCDQKVKIVANLPYNVATVLLGKWLTSDPWPPFFDSLTLMFQKEVAERIVAKPSTKAYGRLSILAGWRTTAQMLFDVPARAFTPPPKVTSTIVQLDVRPTPLAPADLSHLQKIVAAAFNQRRKMLRQSLKGLGLRAENLTIEDFCSLSRTYRDLIS